MKLYTLKGSRYGTRCLIQIAAKGMEVEIETVPFPVPESFRALNPLMLVPVLHTDDGKLLPESQVICEYLEDLCPDPSLRPIDPAECARMRLLIRLFELHYDPVARRLFPLLRPGVSRDHDEVDAIGVEIANRIDLISSYLDGRAYAVGGHLSLADCALMPPFMQARIICPRLGLNDPIGANQKIADYYERTRDDTYVKPVLDDAERYIRSVLRA